MLKKRGKVLCSLRSSVDIPHWEHADLGSDLQASAFMCGCAVECVMDICL